MEAPVVFVVCLWCCLFIGVDHFLLHLLRSGRRPSLVLVAAQRDTSKLREGDETFGDGMPDLDTGKCALLDFFESGKGGGSSLVLAKSAPEITDEKVDVCRLFGVDAAVKVKVPDFVDHRSVIFQSCQ